MIGAYVSFCFVHIRFVLHSSYILITCNLLFLSFAVIIVYNVMC